ncbi:MAG: aspartate--ammonia ligase [Deltaproteobacteria bacterium]|nr:aspartate--ammonia ligase [Deltaproteobacteria bacterium]
MAQLIIPKAYRPKLSVLEMESAIKDIKDSFERSLADALGLVRVTAPLFVRAGSGLNDDLNGVESPVRFRVRGDGDAEAEIVQSLAKWKRAALARYGFEAGQGIYTDMNAIRPDEELDNLHSIYVDQWDWEKIIEPAERVLATLERAVRAIYSAVRRCELRVASRHAGIEPALPEELTFITSEALQARYPELTPAERETRIAREHGAVFLIGIGAELADGRAHDGRAPDYDDWSSLRADGGRGLNGDLLLWHPVLDCALEISSMGVRVDARALRCQLELRGCTDREQLPFHRQLLAGELPQTMGGGIGQSRLCMYYLRTAHIGEVAVGLWPESTAQACAQAGILLL